MKLLPLENITYKTRLTETEAINRLSQNLEPVKMIRFRSLVKVTKPYEGKVSGMNFSIRRVINYRNSFLPRISGIVERGSGGSVVKVKMRLHKFVIVFVCFWFIALLGISVGFLIAAYSENAFAAAVFIPPAMFIFMYVLMMVAFNSESNRSKKDLAEIFEGEITDH